MQLGILLIYINLMFEENRRFKDGNPYVISKYYIISLKQGYAWPSHAMSLSSYEFIRYCEDNKNTISNQSTIKGANRRNLQREIIYDSFSPMLKHMIIEMINGIKFS